ncbi:18866_t:CDS:2 [Gigaspora margarita]|uniref:18866_t:CDS:1 n=1 Tax=Gigaspora margarita TaxID=4874 RepID=A0ABN7UZ27_GIGMA|nr:18866_t:CDS:2 [Gigaspora margarita]
MSYDFTSEFLNINIKNTTIYQNILNTNNISSFSQYIKCRIQSLERMINNLDNNSNQNIFISRYNKEKQRFISQIEDLKKENLEYISQIVEFKKGKKEYQKQIKRYIKEIDEFKSRIRAEKKYEELEKEILNLNSITLKHQKNETNLLYELDKLRQENKTYKSNLTRLKQESLDFINLKNENEVITNLIKNAYHIVEEKLINYNVLDLYDMAIYFKNTLKIMGGSFYDRHITMNIPSLLLQNYSIRTIQNSQFLEYIPTFEEILGFTTEAKRYFSLDILCKFLLKDDQFKEGNYQDYVRFIFYKIIPLALVITLNI